jgi:hypothetical protein|tara:strand:- start:844 stop:1728 length:885 start_codon:yes stop_codon:yes gene_type:complete
MIKLYPIPIESEYIWNGATQNGSNPREWVAEKIQSKKDLLICIGDSWTWGESLGGTNSDFNNKKVRYTEFYTNRLAEKLESDWLMIGWCGTSNTWIMKQYMIIKQAIESGYYEKYENVYVHVCLTELFREIVIAKQIIKKKLNDIKTFEDFSKSYFDITVLKHLDKFLPIPKFHSFSKNCWDIDLNCDQYNFLNTTWQDLLFKKQKINYKIITPMVSGVAIPPFQKYCKENNLKDILKGFLQQTKHMVELVRLFDVSKLNSEKSTRHPSAEGHQIWADYLYNYYSTLRKPLQTL